MLYERIVLQLSFMISFIVTRFEGSIFGGEEQRAAERNELRDRTYDRPRDEVRYFAFYTWLS